MGSGEVCLRFLTCTALARCSRDPVWVLVSSLGQSKVGNTGLGGGGGGRWGSGSVASVVSVTL